MHKKISRHISTICDSNHLFLIASLQSRKDHQPFSFSLSQEKSFFFFPYCSKLLGSVQTKVLTRAKKLYRHAHLRNQSFKFSCRASRQLSFECKLASMLAFSRCVSDMKTIHFRTVMKHEMKYSNKFSFGNITKK